MAIATPTNVAAVTGGSTANASTYDTAVTTLTAGRLYLLTVCNYKSSTPAIPTTVTHDPLGTPLSLTLVTDGATNASVVSFDSAAHRSVSVWYVIPGSTTASALIRITGMGSCSSCGWSLTEIASGFDATTTFPKVAVNSGLQTAAIAVTMAAFADTNNLTYLAMGWGDGTANPAETISPTEGRSELEEHGDAERSRLGDHYQNPNGSDTSIGATLSASTVDWGAIGIELAVASTASLITDSDAGTLTDNRSLTGQVIPVDSGTFADNRSLTAETVNADAATVAELEVANLTQNVVDSDSATLTDNLSALSIQGIPTDAGTVAESISETLAAGAADAGTLTEVRLANVAQTATDAGTLTETPALGAALVNADAGTLAEAESASQAGTGGGPATDTESASLVEQAIAELLASVSDSASATDGSVPVGAVIPIESATLAEAHSGSLELVTADVGIFADTESIGGLPPVDSDTDAFTFGDEAVASYRFPPPRRSTRLMRHGRGTWLIQGPVKKT